MHWMALFKPGDWLVISFGVIVCAVSWPLAWQSGAADKAVVKRGGEVFAELDLSRNRSIEVPGPLGITKISVDKRRVRVVRPGAPSISCTPGLAGASW